MLIHSPHSPCPGILHSSREREGAGGGQGRRRRRAASGGVGRRRAASGGEVVQKFVTPEGAGLVQLEVFRGLPERAEVGQGLEEPRVRVGGALGLAGCAQGARGGRRGVELLQEEVEVGKDVVWR